VIREVPGRRPRIDPDTYIDPQAAVIGFVTIGAGSSVWPFAVLRGDQDNYVTLGRNSNVQDNSVLHVTPEFPCIVGDFVTIGHRAVAPARSCRRLARHGRPGQADPQDGRRRARGHFEECARLHRALAPGLPLKRKAGGPVLGRPP
jgi:hypothetical protein